MYKYIVKITMGYDDLSFEFNSAESAEIFATTAFDSIVREEDNNGKLKDVSIHISSYITTKVEEEED